MAVTTLKDWELGKPQEVNAQSLGMEHLKIRTLGFDETIFSKDLFLLPVNECLPHVCTQHVRA